MRALATQMGKQLAFNKAINRYINMTLGELRLQMKREDLPIIEMIATQVLIKAAEAATPRHIEMTLYTNLSKKLNSKPRIKETPPLVPPDLPEPTEFAAAGEDAMQAPTAAGEE